MLRRSHFPDPGVSPSPLSTYIYLSPSTHSLWFYSLSLQTWPCSSALVPHLPGNFRNSHCHWNPRCLKWATNVFLNCLLILISWFVSEVPTMEKRMTKETCSFFKSGRTLRRIIFFLWGRTYIWKGIIFTSSDCCKLTSLSKILCSFSPLFPMSPHWFLPLSQRM